MSHPIEEGFEVGLADELDGFLKRGDWGERTAIANQALVGSSSPELYPQESESILKARRYFVENIIIAPFFLERDNSNTTLGEEAKKFYEHFNITKEKTLKMLGPIPTVLGKPHLRAVENTTIIHVHKHAEERFDFFSRELGGYFPGSDRYKEIKPIADYWNIVEQTAKESVEIDFRERS